jgi:L-alanine-DL-glutamate epimerase-like enolase superfamily enzyme
MKIKQISVYQVDLPIQSITISGGRTFTGVDSTIVALETDEDITGWGEACPLGATYLPAFALGARAGIAEIAPHLVGEDPRRITRINQVMDSALAGHPYVKSAFDMACWDALGKSLGVPLCELFGGRVNDELALTHGVFVDTPAKMVADIEALRQNGYRYFTIKVGSAVEEDIDRIRATHAAIQPAEILGVDANGGWLVHEATRVVRAVKDLDVYFEQPCSTYEECLKVRRQTDHPFILDESMDSLNALLRGYHDDAMDAVVIKLAKVGGLSKARIIKDVCVELGIPIRIEESWGSAFVVAATAQLAHSVPANRLFASYGEMTSLKTAEGAPEQVNGRLKANNEPGLGLMPLPSVLGEPVAVFY